MKRQFMFLFLLVAIVGNCLAESTNISNQPCENWKRDTSLRTRAWIAGFMSGLNAMWEGKPNDPLSVFSSPQQVYAWMDDYCRSNPSNTLQDGGIALFKEAIRRKSN